MKCSLSVGDVDSRCERCARKSLNCIFQEHRRGRKLGTRISRSRSVAMMTLPVPSESRAENVEPIQDSWTPASQSIESIPDSEPTSLQPSGLLNHEAMRGKFSLGYILSTTNGHPLNSGPNDVVFASAEDPIMLGLVNVSIAKSLFKNFMEVLNPYISQLDPVLHTFAYVRQKSPFLLTTILAMAAKAFNPALYEKLHDHAQNLYGDCFRRGKKSTEIAQAILILTYWKEPEDTRAWTSLGYVIRMCMDLGWHRLMPYSARSRVSMTEKETREIRNIERTWYVLFVYDRSISLQTGKPWMMERNEFIESIDLWCKDPMVTSNDKLLGAFVTLRLMTSTVYKLLSQKPQTSEGRGPLHNIESLLTIINGRIKGWENLWIQAVETEHDSCHPFLIRFYGTHLRLQLFSLPLQEILASPDADLSMNLEILWVAYSSAIEMLQLLSRYSSRLYFAQDSIHVMTAYSAAFLIKLLLSAPNSIVSEIKDNTISALRAATCVFSQQAAPPGSSCALQAKFLERIVLEFLNKRTEKARTSGNASPDNLGSSHGPSRDRGASPRAPRLPDDLGQLLLDTGDMGVPDTPGLQQIRADFLFTDDTFWADMFVSAGFSLQDGVFFS
ncbi:hypothetical protein EDB80DRAFT_752060 [Ilyonectria destructans]|nr:hypothetical protein EDB80DRAFT_752060 [Ilyonectria destructans]